VVWYDVAVNTVCVRGKVKELSPDLELCSMDCGRRCEHACARLRKLRRLR
jgi:hypothetical protein